jgi:hypothetical protein
VGDEALFVRGSTLSEVAGINDAGAIAGTHFTSDGRSHAFLDVGDLNTLVDPNAHVLLTSALAINDREQILARACDAEGVFCCATVRLDPVPAVPEAPGRSMLLAGLAVLGGGTVRFRKGWSRRPAPCGPGGGPAARAGPDARDAGRAPTLRTGWPSPAPGRQ